jgi:hypothetical protein
MDEPYPCDSTIRFTTSVLHDYDWSKSVIIYPNPTTDRLHINFPSFTSEDLHIQIFDLTGKTVAQHTLPKGNDTITLDLHQLNIGIYFYSITSNHAGYATGKFVME